MRVGPDFELGIQDGQLGIAWQRRPLAQAGLDHCFVGEFAQHLKCRDMQGAILTYKCFGDEIRSLADVGKNEAAPGGDADGVR